MSCDVYCITDIYRTGFLTLIYYCYRFVSLLIPTTNDWHDITWHQFVYLPTYSGGGGDAAAEVEEEEEEEEAEAPAGGGGLFGDDGDGGDY